MCWATDDYDDLVNLSRPTVEQFGIEYLRLNDPICKSDHANLKLWRRTPNWVPTRDRIWNEFLKSCKGIYDKVLLINADVSMRKPLLPHWLEESSILWRCSMLDRHDNIVFRDVASHHMITSPEHANLLDTAIELAKQCEQGYEIEHHLGRACKLTKTAVRFEYLQTKRFVDHAEHIGECDTDFFIDPQPLRFVNQSGQIYYQHVCEQFTTNLDNDDHDPVFIVPQFDQHKFKIYAASNQLTCLDFGMLTLRLPRHGIEFAKIFEKWLTHHPDDSAEYLDQMYKLSVIEHVDFFMIGLLGEHCPGMFKTHKLVTKFYNEPVYNVDDWIICPALCWAAPKEMWHVKPYLYMSKDWKKFQKIFQFYLNENKVDTEQV